MKDGNKRKVIEAPDEGERENTTKGNGERTENSKESLGQHCERDRTGSGKSAESAKVKRFARLRDQERSF
jgi:hypothetical protein